MKKMFLSDNQIEEIKIFFHVLGYDITHDFSKCSFLFRTKRIKKEEKKSYEELQEIAEKLNSASEDDWTTYDPSGEFFGYQEPITKSDIDEVYKKHSYTMTFPTSEYPIYRLLQKCRKSCFMNKFFLINRCSFQYETHWMGNYNIENFIEDRQSINVTAVHSWYVDIDFKNDVHSNKLSTYKKLRKMPCPPHIIVSSRNGLHCYWPIHESERHMTNEEWIKGERLIFNYVKTYISPFVDPRATDIVRILRIPYTIHKKESSNEYLVKPIYIAGFNRRSRKFNYHCGYKANELEALSTNIIHNVTTEFNDCDENISNNISNDFHKLYETHEISISSLPDISDLAMSRYPAVEAIYNGNLSYFSNLKEKLLKSDSWSPKTRSEATTIIKSVDMRLILGVDVDINEKIHSLFYDDITPSDSFYETKHGTIGYQCWCRDETFDMCHITKFYTDIFDIIRRIRKCDWDEAFSFAYDMFEFTFSVLRNEKPYTDDEFNNFCELQIETLKSLSTVKCYKSLEKLLPAYTIFLYECVPNAIHDVETKQNKFIHFNDVHVVVTSRFLAKKGIPKASAQYIINGLETLGIIKPVEVPTSNKFKKANHYKIVDISNTKNQSIIISNMDKLTNRFGKTPWRNASKRELIETLLEM